MTTTGPVGHLAATLRLLRPGSACQVDIPRQPTGIWWLDVTDGERSVLVQWQDGRGFGVSVPPHGYGEGADEVFDDASVLPVALRVAKLLTEPSQ